MARPDDGTTLSPEQAAIEIAPTIDRLRLGIAGAMPSVASELLRRYEVPPPALQLIGTLRHTMPDRVVTRDDLGAVFVYEPDRLALVDEAVRCLLVEELGDSRLRLAPRGQALIAELYRATDAFVAAMWSAQADVVAEVGEIVARLAQRAVGDGGPALGVMAPAYEPDGASTAMLLAERLTLLRFHRFDAHVAAWRQAGLTAAEMRAGPAEEVRAAVEDETNRRAAVPYAHVSATERAVACAGLSALPS